MVPTSVNVDVQPRSDEPGAAGFDDPAVAASPIRSARDAPDPARRRIGRSSIPFFVLQFSPVLIVVTGVSLRSVVLLAVTYWSRMFCITAGYHRYFAHRSYRLARFPQFLVALAGTTALQKGPLWWAAHHRDHHRLADGPGDVHSPLDGFWSSHLLWMGRAENARTRSERIPDLVAYPELRVLDRHYLVAPIVLAVACYLVDGWRGLVVGFLTSTVLLWHATFSINSLAHLVGRRRYATTDSSRNSFVLAVLTMGEGWHNNHHYRPASCRNGFYWWEWDPTYYLIRAFAAVGVATNLRTVSERARERQRVDSGAFDVGMFNYRVAQARQTVVASRTAEPGRDPITSGPAALVALLGDLRARAKHLSHEQRRRDPAVAERRAEAGLLDLRQRR